VTFDARYEGPQWEKGKKRFLTGGSGVDRRGRLAVEGFIPGRWVLRLKSSGKERKLCLTTKWRGLVIASATRGGEAGGFQ